ncbi:MAG: HDOD domain-containing protein [Methylococcales bacterium]
MQINSVQDFLNHVQNELNANRLVLPTFPDVALKVRDAVTKDRTTSQQLADMIVTDAALAARLIQVANSPVYRGAVPVSNIQMAVTRLGSRTISSLITSLVMQQMFKPSTKLLERYFREIWEISVNVSAISRALASFAPHLDPEQAMLAGLIFQIGKLPVLMLAENMPDFRDNPTRLNKLIEKTHPAIGRIIMNTWSFPPELKNVASKYVDFQRDSGEKADYIDIVQVAFLQNVVGTDHPAAQIDWSTVPAFRKLGFSADVEIMEIAGVAEEIALTSALLS